MAQLIDVLFTVYTMMLFGRIISSWFPEYRDYQPVRFVSYYTDPYLNVFRRIIPPLGMMDLSPIAAFIALRILESFVKGLFV